MSAAISAEAKSWLDVSWKGQGRQRTLLQGAVALGRPAGERAVVMAHQRNRELARQQLVEGEPRARRMHRRQIGFVGGGVRGRERRFQPDHFCFFR
jgi:hypothetical protein